MPTSGKADVRMALQDEPMTEEREPKRRLPAWLLGFILAVVIFVVMILVFRALGFGDDPAIQSGVALFL